jgi:uncharacterized protein (TIGR02266 family)
MIDADDLPALMHPRVEVTVAITAESESNFYVGFKEGVSSGGVFVATHAPMSIGCAVDLAIVLPGQETIRARGTVRWLREYSEANGTVPGMGIGFGRLSSADARRIEEFERARAPLFFDDATSASEHVPSPWALVG